MGDVVAPQKPEQMEFAPSLFGCPHEVSTVKTGDKESSVKSCCTLRGHEIWTNCRAYGRCTLREDFEF